MKDILGFLVMLAMLGWFAMGVVQVLKTLWLYGVVAVVVLSLLVFFARH
ncbi:hypothetical protein Caci_7327 [Catenulispora acidiphila DSM 44928]|uniref:Uncharacterized protein n=1 Tax=Catenulispora acidiphila (strain DSM 44928 / JCM 14897 / NBRC 102108 / NRRL B-24433 / ID139908) TaxID=479433 RepID=C7Q8G8_CATAD|nr:hypothetical protein [Catenulispora acidiphila]ACU76156.1 hypothetical protein Caci_7327 [Catenulispora acidiphila DSM 44928]